MGVLAVALAMWAAVYLFAYEREYAGVPVEAGRVMVMEGSVEAFPEIRVVSPGWFPVAVRGFLP